MKKGTIWTMTTIAAIMSADNLDEFEQKGPDFIRIPIDLAEFAEVFPTVHRPTVLYSHLRPYMIPRCRKIIQVQRNPKDIITSFFKYAVLMPSLHAVMNDWDVYVSDFCNKNSYLYGNWFDYMKDWLEKRGDPNILFIQYEDFVEDPPSMVKKLAAFINKPVAEDQVSKIADLVSIESMKKNPKLDHHIPGLFDETKGRFLRKGKVGDWRNYFTDDQNKAFDQFYQKFAEEHKLKQRFDL